MPTDRPSPERARLGWGGTNSSRDTGRKRPGLPLEIESLNPVLLDEPAESSTVLPRFARGPSHVALVLAQDVFDIELLESRDGLAAGFAEASEGLTRFNVVHRI